MDKAPDLGSGDCRFFLILSIATIINAEMFKKPIENFFDVSALY